MTLPPTTCVQRVNPGRLGLGRFGQGRFGQFFGWVVLASVGGSIRLIFGVSRFGPGSVHPKSIETNIRVRTDLEKSLKLTLVLENSWNFKIMPLVLELSWNFVKLPLKM